MQLYLVQHGAAKTEAEDPRRGLTDEGHRAVEKVSRFLGALDLSIDVIEHSGKLRARQTAEILAEHLRPAKGIEQGAGMAPNDDIQQMFQRLQQVSAPLMLVGHLPYLSRLASCLLGLPPDRPAVQFQMGGVVRLDRDNEGNWAIRWIVIPEMLVR
jgi:phosphohistidine phosphatase